MPLEKQLLPSAALEPVHDSLVWLYVYNDFQAGEADRAATRIRIRFSVSSWPQLLLVDPWTMEVVGQTGRTVESFLRAVANTTIERPDTDANPAALLRELATAEALAERLQVEGSRELAAEAIASGDIVARFQAAAWLRANEPAALLPHADVLLQSTNDLLRYEVCQAIAALPADATVALPDGLCTRLTTLLANPGRTRNPNVLKMHVVRALARCGDAAALEAIGALAAGGAPNNSLTRTAIEAVGAIGIRDATTAKRAARILLECFPAPENDPADPERVEWWRRLSRRVAETAHRQLVALTGSEPPFPDNYTDETRETLVDAFRKVVEASGESDDR